MALFLTFPREKTTFLSSGQKWFLRSCVPLIRGMFLLKSGLRFLFHREGGKGQFRVKVAFSSLLSFLERLDWPNCTQRQGPTGRLFFSIWGGFGSGIEKKVGWRGGSGRVEELNFWSGISGYLIYSRVFPVMSDISGYLGYTRYSGLPDILGYPIPNDFQKLNQMGSGIEKMLGSRWVTGTAQLKKWAGKPGHARNCLVLC